MSASSQASGELIRAYRFRLYPSADQAEVLRKWIGTTRFVFNLALEQRRDFWRQYHRVTGRHISRFSQINELTALRQAADWIADCPRDALEAAISELDRAFQAFFAGRAGYPSPRRRDQNCGFQSRSREVPVRRLNAKWAVARIPKLGEVRFRITREIKGSVKTVTVREDADGWSISFGAAATAVEPTPPGFSVGIDRGVSNTIAFSTGELLSLPEAIAAVDRRRQRAQRILARRVKGSNRRAKAKARVASLHARARRMRADWLHRASTDITRRFGLVAIEALNIRGMSASAAGTVEEPGTKVAQKRGLNRTILSQGWGQFEQMLAYKLEASGGALIRVPAAYTSQTCSACGAVDHRSRESQAVFRCVHCGHEDHADINAAKEILRRSTSGLLVEGSRQRPVEARTTGAMA